VVFILAVKMGMDRFRFQQRLDEMEEQKKQAELDFLNAQFNPHFLFNSIHSIYGHIDKQNTTARNMLLTFSEMLRYQLYDCNSHTVNIEKETGYLKNYVALQKARKEENVAVELHVAEEVKGFLIAPLLFVPFIENSFKYVGNSEETENKVRVSLQKTADILWFNCYNTREPGFVSTIAHKGIGMANVKRRLSLLYPGKHELEINDGPGFYEVNLKIQLA
jgi:LytS/YehU family sensor histidine kinase